ncbi:nicotinate (nicotinamide) nucleotide adenylyltransferase [uncultured Limnohabitans sp.]|uniref:nicotinate (nicotinamide) nucleotide adenylyltransferase n=1 Tax=uncultured Limnohabitans sp. TaxID=768543 RepID=UPI001B48E871|nr:nicotinate (nicotinamide) nucleotide adenylyltransferase [uncultured Limnohabitans sp.]MBP6221046.1 nicotinate (nicotinamide) nucleotide adenylyltransferase [Limnohabitans sp.]MBP6244277.1 nicotinate (nicotinamide) nucleotide adenylyltransferase [Limnohabitans sp.]
MGLSLPPVNRLGVFGGAFDPPHLAHVALVEAAVAALQLDQVRVLPTGLAWHKTRTLSEAHHRLAMTRLAYQHLPQVVVDDREIRRSGASYTVDTLRELQAEFPQAQLYLLLGDDQRRALPSWHQIDEIGRIAIICAAGRDMAVRAWNEELGALQTTPPLSDKLQARIRTLEMPLMPHSATDIRELLAKEQAITSLVPPAVERYIHEHHLYRPH